VSLISSKQEQPAVRMLIDSIRSFGGTMAGYPILLFERLPGAADPWRGGRTDVKVLPLIVPDAVEGYPLAAKVYACARAEDRAREWGLRTLVWIDPACLVVNPPVLFDFGDRVDAALRPVHIQNVGLPAAAPLDEYWHKVYEAVGVRDIGATVESFVDRRPLRAYFNTHAFAVAVAKGLMREWYDVFAALVGDEDFQSGACNDESHKVFLHQAVLSALIAAAVDWDRVRILPPEYNYPYNLHDSVPTDRRARVLNDLTTVVHEDRSLDPAAISDIELREPLRSWLGARATPS
jgi:hypothetical protein